MMDCKNGTGDKRGELSRIVLHSMGELQVGQWVVVAAHALQSGCGVGDWHMNCCTDTWSGDALYGKKRILHCVQE